MKITVIPTRYHTTFQVIDEDTLTPMAYGSINITFEDGVKVAKLLGDMRHPDYNGMGVCSKLANERIKMAKALGCKKVYIGILKTRKNYIKLFQQLGFKEVKCKSKNHRRFCYDKLENSLW